MACLSEVPMMLVKDGDSNVDGIYRLVGICSKLWFVIWADGI